MREIFASAEVRRWCYYVFVSCVFNGETKSLDFLDELIDLLTSVSSCHGKAIQPALIAQDNVVSRVTVKLSKEVGCNN